MPASGAHDMAAFVAAASTATDPTVCLSYASVFVSLIRANLKQQTASGILTGIGAVATAPAGTSSAAPAASTSASGAVQLVAGAGSLLAGLFAAVYTLA